MVSSAILALVTSLSVLSRNPEARNLRNQQFLDVFEESLNRPVKVIPDEATCGVSSSRSIHLRDHAVECTTDCERRYPRQLQEDQIIRSPGITFGKVSCPDTEEQGVESGNQHRVLCGLKAENFTFYEEETYVMWIKPLSEWHGDDNLQSTSSGSIRQARTVLDAGSLRFDLGDFGVISGPKEWSTASPLSIDSFNHIAFQVNSILGTISLFINGSLQNPVMVGNFAEHRNLGVLYVGTTGPGVSDEPWIEVKSLSRYHGILTNREIQAIHSGELPEVASFSHCLCPNNAPAISITNSDFCTDNTGTIEERRFEEALFTASSLTDGNIHTAWASAPGYHSPITLEIDFGQDIFVPAINIDMVSLNWEPNPTTGFSVSLLRQGDWGYIQHAARDCVGAGVGLPEKATGIPHTTFVSCKDMDSITFDNLDTTDYELQLLEGRPGWLDVYERPGWLDVSPTRELQQHLSGSAIRVTLHGLSEDVTHQLAVEQQVHIVTDIHVMALTPGNLKWKPAVRHQRSLKSLDDTFVRENGTDCSHCYTGGAIYCHQTTAECFCRPEAGHPSKAEGTCSPYIDEIIPGFGPDSGGTEILVAGGFLGNTDGIKVFLGDTAIEMEVLLKREYSESGKQSFKDRYDAELSEDTLIHCITPAINTTQSPNVTGVPMYLIIQLADGTVFTTGNETFTYKPDPIIDNIHPAETFASGGINQTITGKNFDSVHTIFMTLFAIYSTKRIDGAAPNRNTCPYCVQGRHCDVQDSETMVCPTPKFLLSELPDGGGQRRKKRELIIGAINHPSQEKDFFVGFVMDGVKTYLGEALARRIWMYPNPSITRFKGGVHIFHHKDKTLEIKGGKLSYGCKKKDYTVNIGKELCIIEVLAVNHIICTPPEKQPEPDVHHKDGRPEVKVTVGNLVFSLGYIEYSNDNLLDEPEVRNGIIGGAIGLVVLIAIIVIVIYVWRRICQQPPAKPIPPVRPNPYENQPPVEQNPIMYLPEELQLDVQACLISPKSWHLGPEIGQGHFGTVHRGTVTMENDQLPLTVAIKTVKDAENAFFKDKAEFLKEATQMQGFEHENILPLMGVVLDNNIPYIILPFMDNGSLKDYVSNTNNRFSVKDLLQQGSHVSKGMAYLSSMFCIHRDLAARNCMVDKNMVVKVADFGLARDAYEKGYYSAEDKHRQLPVKWMAIESLEMSRFSQESDVWSYGVLLWELFTRCEVTPYPDVDRFNVKKYLLSGRRMDKPPSCPDEIYHMMLECWSHNPSDRPGFVQIVSQLNDILIEAPPTQKASRRKGGNSDYLNLSVLNIPTTTPSSEGGGYLVTAAATALPLQDDASHISHAAAAAQDNEGYDNLRQ